MRPGSGRLPPFPLLLLALAAACASPPVTEELGPPYSLSTPRNTIEYFRESVRRDSPSNEFRCFSERMKREYRLGYGDYSLIREDVREDLEARWGPIERIRVTGERVMVPDREVQVTLRGAGREEKILLIRETFWEVVPVDNDLETAFGDIGGIPDVAEAAEDGLHVRLPLREGERTDPGAIHRILVRSDWKFWWPRSDASRTDFERMVRKARAEATPPGGADGDPRP